MTGPTPNPQADLVGRDVVDASGERIGQLSSLYLDSETSAPTFAGVAMIRRGRRRTVLVPLVDAAVGPTRITVICGKELARRAPSLRPGQLLTPEAEPGLFAHYDLPYHAASRGPRRLIAR